MSKHRFTDGQKNGLEIVKACLDRGDKYVRLAMAMAAPARPKLRRRSPMTTALMKVTMATSCSSRQPGARQFHLRLPSLVFSHRKRRSRASPHRHRRGVARDARRAAMGVRGRREDGDHRAAGGRHLRRARHLPLAPVLGQGRAELPAYQQHDAVAEPFVRRQVGGRW